MSVLRSKKEKEKMIHSLVAHAFVFVFCLAVLVFDPIHEHGNKAGQVYPRPSSQTAYIVHVHELN